ncbi:MAG: BrnA antitoxin family protein [Rhodospirillaceae bacterium]|nr:BrnA antitoxin family protein [Rhodospirillaceae bacterium]
MAKRKERIVRYTNLDDIPDGKTDWARVRALTDADIAKAVAEDPDAAPLLDEAWFRRAVVVAPPAKADVHIKLDQDVVQWFKRAARASGGRGYQTRINAVLRAYVDAHAMPRARKRA